MFRPTTGIALAGLVVVGVILADFWAKPAGTNAAANGIVAIEKPSLNALLGQTS
jgi:hypothetical protein